jgi:hypothetical protein
MKALSTFHLPQKFPTYAHGVYVPKKLAEACKVDGKVVKLTSADKKRRERNNREQQRSCKISKQIDQLKELLHSSGFKVADNNPNKKNLRHYKSTSTTHYSPLTATLLF